MGVNCFIRKKTIPGGGPRGGLAKDHKKYGFFSRHPSLSFLCVIFASLSSSKLKVIFFGNKCYCVICPFFNCHRLLLDLHIKCHISYLGFCVIFSTVRCSIPRTTRRYPIQPSTHPLIGLSVLYHSLRSK